MDQLLDVKVGCLVALLFLTLICGFAPPFLNWFMKSRISGTYELVICLISSFAAGIFLGACLLHVVADALTDIATELSYIDYPMGELILSLGFFLVVFIERVVLQISMSFQRSNQDDLPLPSIPTSPDANFPEKGEPPSEIAILPEEPHNHIHPNMYSLSSFRSLILFCSLSVHSVFEGLAIGLQSKYASALQIAIAVLIHKGIIVFSLSLKLIQSRTTKVWLSIYIVIFSLMSPIGITIGIVVTLKKSAIVTVVQAVLEGISSGTFVYVTFLEILPSELNSGTRPILRLFFIVIGFTIMAVIAIWA
ncbi:zinc transporter ZIP2 [Hyla sarda]|uniref:zinc transporter ZIP2 n=1 Tax=Hyla sarda TaxID=327740 RepID=UPI0024C2BB16|nr:zinc transporter ZIP2 [Hyla sarda]